MGVTIQFLGAAGTVTGSKYLVSGGGKKILVDAGLFQGPREWRDRNWDDAPVDLAEIDAVLITHAHIDHTGILPRYVAQGLSCPVFTTGATAELSSIMLPDSGRLQEEEAEYRGSRGRSRHHPPLPLYTEADARAAVELFRTVPFAERHEVLPGIHATWRRMGHILGAASIELSIGGKSICFSGDIGRYTVPILTDPDPMPMGDLLLIESTYGNRLHDQVTPPKVRLGEIIMETVQRRGVIVIPSFAVGRAQELLYHLRELKGEGAIPDLPVIVDSPMAQDATSIYFRHPECYDDDARKLLHGGSQPFKVSKMHFVRDRDESIRLNGIHEPMVLISASGMLSGGRILHHLKQRISNPRNTILFVGYQPPGGRGDWIKSGAESLTLMGEEVPIKAHIEEISGFSAHGDRDELLRWARSCPGTPGKVAVVHGEPESAASFAATLSSEMKWNAQVAKYLEEWTV